MARTPQDVTQAELAILQALWDRGPATIRQLTEGLYPGSVTTAQYGTVQKLLERLERKHHVQRQRSPMAHLFAAAVERDELIGRRLEDVAAKLCGGSLTPLLTHLVRTRKLTARERRELRELIDEQERPDRPRRTPQ
jgi:predicted transcriptional regulator